MRPSFLKFGNAYRPAIRDDAGKVVWQAKFVCRNRHHSTPTSPSAYDLAKFALEAATKPDELQSAMKRLPPDCVRRNEWEMQAWRERMQQYAWALAHADEVKSAITVGVA